MDDESNVKSDFKQLRCFAFCTALHQGKVDNYFKLPKFAKNYMVWQAICSCGINNHW